MSDFPEADWKVFRRIREAALARYCQRVLDELAQIGADTSRSAHERYLTIYKVIGERDEDLREAFDNPRRSEAFLQLLSIRSQRLITDDELGEFSEDIRERVLKVCEEGG